MSERERLYQFFSMLYSGLIVVHIITEEEKKVRTIREEPLPPFDHLAPSGSRAILHDGVGWHGDEWLGPDYDQI